MRNWKKFYSTCHCIGEKVECKSKNLLGLFNAVFAVFVLTFFAQAASNGPQLSTTGPGAGGIFKITQTTTSAMLKKLPDNTVIELSNGKHVKMKEIRKLSAISLKLQKAQSLPMRPLPKLKFQPAATGIPVSSLSEINSALDLADSATIQLPSGQLLTVEQLKFLKPLLEERLGKTLSRIPKKPLRTGNAIKVEKNGSKSYWDDILRKPDDTLLESPGGTLVTVGELKKYMPDSGDSSKKSPQIQN